MKKNANSEHVSVLQLNFALFAITVSYFFEGVIQNWKTIDPNLEVRYSEFTPNGTYCSSKNKNLLVLENPMLTYIRNYWLCLHKTYGDRSPLD